MALIKCVLAHIVLFIESKRPIDMLDPSNCNNCFGQLQIFCRPIANVLLNYCNTNSPLIANVCPSNCKCASVRCTRSIIETKPKWTRRLCMADVCSRRVGNGNAVRTGAMDVVYLSGPLRGIVVLLVLRAITQCGECVARNAAVM